MVNHIYPPSMVKELLKKFHEEPKKYDKIMGPGGFEPPTTRYPRQLLISKILMSRALYLAELRAHCLVVKIELEGYITYFVK